VPSAFESLCGAGKPLHAEQPMRPSSKGLRRSGLARLADAGKVSLALESRFDLAYNAAHALCLAHCVGTGIARAIDTSSSSCAPHASASVRRCGVFWPSATMCATKASTKVS